VNVSEKDGVIQVEAAIPGMDDKELDVSIRDDVLILKGEHKEEKEEKGKEIHRKEFTYGSFERTIALPARVQADKAEAKFEHGVLTLKLPVVQEDRARVKKIPIKAG
jgi:HSP20 family protein